MKHEMMAKGMKEHKSGMHKGFSASAHKMKMKMKEEKRKSRPSSTHKGGKS